VLVFSRGNGGGNIPPIAFFMAGGGHVVELSTRKPRSGGWIKPAPWPFVVLVIFAIRELCKYFFSLDNFIFSTKKEPIFSLFSNREPCASAAEVPFSSVHIHFTVSLRETKT